MHHLILVAGGTGTRMHRSVAKQFLPLGGRPVIFHTLERFRAAMADLHIVLVLHDSLHEEWQALVAGAPDMAVDAVVTGGEERFHSVRNGLDALPEGGGLVAIHDAVRPFVEVETIQRCFAVAGERGAAIPVVPVKDTIRRIDSDGNAPLDRATLRAVQTPQVFDLNDLRACYGVEYRSVFTDDASVWEAQGRSVELVEGDLHNLKITTPEDLLSAEAFLSMRSPQVGNS